MTSATETALKALRDNIESDGFADGYGMVYLDNALADAGLSKHAFAGSLSQLQQRGVYRPVDDCFGEVRRAD